MNTYKSLYCTPALGQEKVVVGRHHLILSFDYLDLGQEPEGNNTIMLPKYDCQDLLTNTKVDQK